ncbi:MAG: winged helix-turn-helix transcriptional regulator [Anaerolineales bacterium]|nr:winged helix-turn-helix transcriptional regulator [Anaerolineales bacterium]MCA9928014.1 winged helix-turn-helix transcriptional regulator [Anaerolineales bacterium]
MNNSLDLGTCALIAANCAAGNLRRTTRLVSQMYDEALRPVGLRGTQFMLLIALTQTGPVPISQLAEALAMDRTTLSRNLKPLEREGWVQTESGDDRRRRLVMLTGEGEDVLVQALPLWEGVQAQIVAGFGPERFAAFLGELTAVQQLTRT